MRYLLFTLSCLLSTYASASNPFLGGCDLYDVTIQVGSCDDGDPDVVVFFGITGGCTVSQVCFLEEGVDIGCADVADLEIGDTEGVNFGGLLADTFYEFSVILSDGSVFDGYSVANGNCGDFICDCAGTQHTSGVLAWLGDDYADIGGDEFLWEEQIVDFNCSTWGFDCGDVDPNLTDDPYEVCSGGLPPNGGCGLLGDCTPLGLTLAQGDCADNDADLIFTPTINVVFQIEGDCPVEELCFSEDGGENFDCFDLLGNGDFFFDGDGINLINTIPNQEYHINYTVSGITSETFIFLNGNCDDEIEGCTNSYAVNFNPEATIEDFTCIYDETICDCEGNEHTIGVLTWLGDTFPDDGTYLWEDELEVYFDCETWGYDCGDIDGAPTSDPNNVCNGGLPANNGCEVIVDCFAEISAIQQTCVGGVDELNFFMNVDGQNCGYNELCYSINGGAIICEDLSWVPQGFDFTIANPATFSQIVYYVSLMDGTVSDQYTINTTDCNNLDVCLPISMDLFQEDCGDTDGVATPTIGINFNIAGDCLVEDVCFSIDGGDYTCYTLEDFEIFVGNGEGIVLNNTTPDVVYSFYYTTIDGVSAIQSFQNGNCDGVIVGCTNEYATNYNADAELEDGSCIYDETICDCAGTQHTIGVLAWLGDTFEDIGGTEFFWDGQTVDFGCSTWGYDCGDIEGSPSDDPYGACNGSLPPDNGCIDLADCSPFDIVLEEDCFFDVDNSEWVPRILVTTYFNGECIIEEVCEEGTLTAENCYLLPDFDIFLASGEGVFLPVAGGDTYTVTATTPDGTISETIFIGTCADATFGCTNPYASNYDAEADEEDGTCTYDETICDCAGTIHSIGVITWIGDGFEDIGGTDFTWDDQAVDFNCAIWAYDCGDIEGAPDGDPYGVCEGGIPPNNGCGINEVFGCTDTEALNYDPNATQDDDTCEYEAEVFGCTDPLASNYNPNANVNNGTCEYDIFGCTDTEATNYNPLANVDNGTCIYVDIEGCTDPNANNYDPFANINDGSCTYGCLLPTMSILTICEPSVETGFYVEIEVSNIGDAAPYNVTNNVNGQSLVLSQTGSFTFGPFDNNASVVLSFASVNTPNCLFISEILTDNCGEDIIEGCTDEEAVNYDPEATLDDGSCIYECEYPIIIYSTFCEDNEEDVFYVQMEVESLGNGAPYAISNNVNDETLSLNFIGTLTLGPYDNEAQVLYTLESEVLEECLLTSSVLSDDCSAEVIEGCTDDLATNYNADATVDDGSCIYDFMICDCVGNMFSPSVLDQLGDGSPNDNIVNFNCATWGYDCGDIAGAPDSDPFSVCEGNLPPLNGCTDNINEELAVSFELYPNPTLGEINIIPTGFHSALRIDIYSSTGKLVKSEQDVNANSRITLNLESKNLASGIYLVRISDEENTLEKKIILENK